MASTTTPLAVKAQEPKNKAKTSGCKSKISPTTSLDIRNTKKCSSSELQMLAKALNERIIKLYDDVE